MEVNSTKEDKITDEIQKVGIAGICGNMFLFIIKICVGLVTQSYSMIADSINSGTDILASLMTYVGGKISGTPSDNEHNYGHGKAEYIFTMLISVITIYLSLKIAFDGVGSLLNNEKFIFSWWLVVVCFVTIFVKLGLYVYAKGKGRKIDNILILANAQDHINDVLITSSVLVGVLAALLKIFWLDGVIAILIAVRICYVGIKFFIDSYNVLMDASVGDGEMQTIREIIEKNGEISHIDKITSKPVGNKFILIIKISVDENMTVKESHSIAGKMKFELLKLSNIYDVIVHINPA